MIILVKMNFINKGYELEDRLIEIIREASRELKHSIEERVGIKLGDVFVGKYSPSNAGRFYDAFLDSKMGSFMAIPPNKILFTSAEYKEVKRFLIDSFNEYYRLVFRYLTLHEMYHIASFKLNKRFEPAITKNQHELRTIDILGEGFACYMALDESEFLYEGFDKIITANLKKRAIDSFKESQTKDDSYYLGYTLAKRVTNSLGQEELLRLMKEIDITIEEALNPELYIQRRNNEIR